MDIIFDENGDIEKVLSNSNTNKGIRQKKS